MFICYTHLLLLSILLCHLQLYKSQAESCTGSSSESHALLTQARDTLYLTLDRLRMPGEYLTLDGLRMPGEYLTLDRLRMPGEYLTLDSLRMPGESLTLDRLRMPGEYLTLGSL